MLKRSIKAVIGVLLIIPQGFFVTQANSDCESRTDGIRAMHVEAISFLNSNGRLMEFESLVADDNFERASGYQFVCEETIQKTTILFVYPAAKRAKFHMNNVKGALDIGFFDDRGMLIDQMLMDTYDDGNSRLYSPTKPFRFALEAKPGFFAENSLKKGSARLLLNSIYDSK
jgi:uncharacterized membrane protein (UPF0127 family)